MHTPAHSLSMLDQNELLQLALNATETSDSGTAIGYLKEAVSRSDASATAHYLLGAEYAQIKMYDRAAGEMEAAIALDPSLVVARFQLGLLWLSSGNAAQALLTLEPLSELAKSDPFFHFGIGLKHLVADEFSCARQSLIEGISLNASNTPLNLDMQKLINEIDQISVHSEAQDAEELGAETKAPMEANQIFLSAYAENKGN
jgi:tetratricopeptide (TPR) repeat protein